MTGPARGGPGRDAGGCRGGIGAGAAGAGVPETRLCCRARSVWKVCAVFSWPSRNWRCSWAVCSLSFWRASRPSCAPRRAWVSRPVEGGISGACVPFRAVPHGVSVRFPVAVRGGRWGRGREVRPGDLDRQAGLAGRFGDEPLVPAREADRVAERGEPGQDTGEVGDVPPPASRGVHGDGGVRALAEDRADEPGELAVGADFQEGPDARAVQCFDLRDELDRPGELPGEQGAGRVGIVRVGLGRGVGVDRDARGREGDGAQLRAKRPARLGDEPAVKGGGDGQRARCDRALLEQPRGPRDLLGGAGKDRLLGSVLVRDHQIKPFVAQHGFHPVERREDGEHRAALTRAVGHQRPSSSREVMKRLVFEPARRAQGRQFAEAVPRDGVGPHTEVVEHAEQPETDRADRGLSHLRGAKRLVLPRADVVGEGRMRVNPVAQTVVGQARAIRLAEHGLERGELAGQVAEHPHILRPLAREQHGESAGRGAVAVIDSLGGPIRVRKVRPRLLEQARAVVVAPDDQDEPVRIVGRGTARGSGRRRRGTRSRAGRGSRRRAPRGPLSGSRPRRRRSGCRRPSRSRTEQARPLRARSESCCRRTRRR